VARVGIFLIAMALIVVMVGCDGTTIVKYNLTMAANPVGGGTATDLTNTSPYIAGAGVSIEAVANPGYQFVSWTAPAGGFTIANAAQTTFTMPAQDVTVTANFALEIRDWNDLDDIRNNLGGSYLLMNGLDSNTAGYTELASPTANEGKGWQPIGSIGDVFTGELVDPFAGTFDGQGYEIEDLFIDRPDEDGVGLFGGVDVGGVIENIEVMDADVTGSWGVGILAGVNGGSVSSSYSIGSVSGSVGVGGLMGGTGGTSCSISDSYSIASVSGFNAVGGLVGFNGGNVSNSYADGDVTGEGHVGGLVGSNYYGTVGSSHATGSVEGSEYVGGLVGGSTNSSVSNCYAIGTVAGGNCTGGLVGAMNISSVSDSYATGSVTGSTNVGGLVGYNEEGTVSDSFWDTETSGQATSAGGTGKTTAEMQDIDTFTGAGWDIIAVANSGTRNTGYIWNIVDGVTYPFLSWQPV